MSKVQSRAYFLAIFMAVFALAIYVTPTIGRTGGRPNQTFEDIPLHVGDWGGERGDFDEVTKAALPSAALFLAEYVNSSGDLVQLAIIYGQDLGDFHQPEYCLEGQGWRTLEKRHFSLKEKDGFTHTAVEMHQTMSLQDQIVIYWFATEGKATTELGKHKIKVSFDRIFSKKVKPSALIRFIAPVRTDPERASKAARELASEIGPTIREVLQATP